MFGWIAYDTADMPPVQAIEGVRFRVLRVAEGRSLRAALSAHRAANILRREGVRLALFPPDYPYIPLFARRGIQPPSPVPLYRAAAPAIVRRYLAEQGIDPCAAMVAFAARRVTPELKRCVATLCREIRYIALCADGGEALARALRRDYGVAARFGASDALPPPDLTVVFDGLRVPGKALYLGDGLEVAFDSPYPAALLALLHGAGALDAGKLRVTSVDTRENAPPD